MNQNTSSVSESANLDSSNLIIFFFRWWKPIVILCFLAAVISAIASYLIDEKYKSTVTMFAVPQHSFGEQLLEDIKKEDVLEYGETEDAERLLQVLNSDRIRNKVIEKFDLWTAYEINREDEGSHTLIGKEYMSNVSSKMTRFGSIQVDVLDKDPTQAMHMANYITNLVDTVSNEMRKERARDAFGYAESSYNNLLYEIRILEDSMAVLQKLGLYDLESQVEVLTDQYGAALGANKIKQANEIKEYLDLIGENGNTFVKLQTLIESNYEKEAVLKKRYDLMKIDIDTELQAKFVVDYAAESDKKAYPIRWLIVAMSVIGTFIFSVLILLVLDTLKKLKSENKI